MRRFFLLLLCVAVAMGSVGYARSRRNHAIRAKRHALKVQLYTIQARKKQVLVQLRKAQAREKTFAEQLRDTEQQLGQTKRRIDTAEFRLLDTGRDLRVARRDLGRVRARLAARNDLLEQRLVATQRRGAVSYAAVFFNAADYWDFLSRRRLMTQLVEHDVQLVNAIRADERSADRLHLRLQKKQGEQKQIVAFLENQRILREGLRQLREDQKERAAREADQYETMLAQLARNSNEITAFLQRLVETPEGRARAAIPFRGGLNHPVAGRISSRFGMRFHPVLHRYKLHTGVDFAVSTGTPIHAAGNGVVVHAGWWGAYGNAVIIDHGGGVTTLYGHMSAVGCSNGQVVQKGRVIGRVGNTGWSTGPHCHFEVRRNGVPVNPMAGL